MVAIWRDFIDLDGLLPHEGDLGDQPAYVKEIISTAEGIKSEIEWKDHKRRMNELEAQRREANKKR